jgi:RNA polymerase sigma-70 factor (ECF subfamily)
VSSNCHIRRFAENSRSGEAELPSGASLLLHVEHGSAKLRNHIVTLYDELRPSLMAYLSGLGLSVDEAEDISQESFLRLVRHLAANRKEENSRGWLFRVAHNLTMDLFRSGRRYIAQTVSDEPCLISS